MWATWWRPSTPATPWSSPPLESTRVPTAIRELAAANRPLPGTDRAGQHLTCLLRDRRKALLLVRGELGGAVLSVLALGKLALCERRALLRGRLAEELMPPGFDNGHELPPEAADIAVRRERRVQVVADPVVSDLAFRLKLFLCDRERMLPRGTAVRSASSQRQTRERELANPGTLAFSAFSTVESSK